MKKPQEGNIVKNKLSDLNDHLFAQLERLGEENLSPEKLEIEVQRTNSIVSVSEQVINNAQLALSAAELVAKHGIGKWENMLPLIDGKPDAPDSAKLPDFSDKKK